jgi:hypothetical protein
MMVPRNINIFLPLIAILSGAGFAHCISIASFSWKYLLTFLPISLLILTTILSSAEEIIATTGIPSQLVTENYIKNVIPSNVPIGFNPGSDGPSPVQLIRNSGIADPEMRLGLEYYVFNSFWESPVRPAFQTRGFLSSIRTDFFHFNENTWKSALKLTIGTTPLDKLIPKNYKVAKVIKTFGPIYVVLRRARD